jgi:hypothetical protein
MDDAFGAIQEPSRCRARGRRHAQGRPAGVTVEYFDIRPPAFGSFWQILLQKYFAGFIAQY